MSKRKPDSRDKFFGKKLDEHLQLWKKETGLKEKDFADRVGCSQNMVTRWKKGETHITEYYFEQVLDVLGKKPEDFYPQTHDEKYRYDTEFMSALGKDLESFCDHIGLDTGFLAACMRLGNFDAEMITELPIVFDPLFARKHIPPYRRASLDGIVPSADISKELRYFQYGLDGKKTVINSRTLGLIKEVQDGVMNAFIPATLQARERERAKEVDRMNEFAEYKEIKDESGETKVFFKGPTETQKRLCDPYLKYEEEFFSMRQSLAEEESE